MARPGDGPDRDPFADTAAESSPSLKKRRAVHTGDVVGRYELGDEVGEGGMATVFRARDRELRREVAIKVLFPHLARRPDIVRRFQREARAAAGLEHPNILRIYDVGGDDDGDDPPFIVMELIRGQALLGEIEQRGPMFAEVAACVGALLADALAAAHGAGIIHRDIKPANVLVAPDGRVLLADFGVARLETEDSLVTRTGAVLGTPAYMSPEQATGDTATAKSDLYSLGATLYQLATGSLPFTGSQAKVLAQLQDGALVPAVKKRAEVGPELSRLIDRLMTLEPGARPASAKDVAAELRAIASAGGFGEPAEELVAYFADPKAVVAAKTPGVVRGLVAAGERAIADGKLPRAMALAERASALIPDDPAVIALVHAVTEGGRANQRRRWLAIGAVGVVLAGGAVAGVAALATRHGTIAHADGGELSNERSVDNLPISNERSFDAPSLSNERSFDANVAEMVAPLSDDAGDAVRDAAVAVAHVVRHDAAIDASAVAEAVAADAPAPPADAAPVELGSIAITNDTWCEVTVDHEPAVRKSQGKPLTISVTAGHHVVTCAQNGTGLTWTRQVDVPAGGTATAAGLLLANVTVTSEIAATLDGAALGPGGHTVVKAGYHRLASHGATKEADIRAACVVRDRPELDCYP